MYEFNKIAEERRLEFEKRCSEANRIEIEDIGEYIGNLTAEKLYNEQISKKIDLNNFNLIVFPKDYRKKDKEFCIEFIKILVLDNNIKKTDLFKYFWFFGNVGKYIKAVAIQCYNEIDC